MKAFIKGFSKGLLIAVVFALLLSLPILFIPSLEGSSDYYFLGLLLSLFIGYYFLKKSKQPMYWGILVLLFGVFALPFILGNAQLKSEIKI